MMTKIAFLIAAGLSVAAVPAHAGHAQHGYGHGHSSAAEFQRIGNRDRRLRRGDRVWRDDRGRWRCKRDDGTTGLVVGAAVGALLGREIDGGRDRTVGTILGAAGGALLGREIDRSDARCR